MIELGVLMKDIADKLNTRFSDLGAGVYMIDYPLAQNDGTVRFQYVYGRVERNIPSASGKDVYYINSRAGRFSKDLNLYKLLKENGYSIYASITIIEDVLRTGESVETVSVYASTLADSADEPEVKFLIKEVAEFADYLEKNYFGGEDNV